MKKNKLGRNYDAREISSYTIPETSHYLRIPISTLKSWVLGRYYKTNTGKKFFKPIMKIADIQLRLLSFLNLIEVHILDAIRREHNIPLYKVRIALNYLNKEFPSKHPLANQNFETNGMDLFIEKYGELINISSDGQLAIKELLKAHLRRVKRDPAGIPIKLYPFTRKREAHEPMDVVIDPDISFGRPVLVGTGIATAIVAERYKAGESINDLAKDYECKGSAIEEAIRCEMHLEAA